jgi:putative methionine-R-sulfoxide reductase with GAF domain/GNAT superfamily N-acetyltransferase
VSQPIEYRWRGPVTDAEVVALAAAHGGRAPPGWWDQIRPHSLGWVTARQPDGALAGWVNVAWDGGAHAFLLDTKVATEYQRQGIATALAGHAARHAQAAGCEWLHVDFEEHLARFYFDACGFRPTAAGLIHLATHRPDREPPARGTNDDVIAQMGAIVAGNGSRGERAGRTADLVRRSTDARWVGIYTITGTVVTCEGWSGPGAPAYPTFAVTDGLTAHALRTGAVALSNDVSGDPRYLANQEDSGSELIVPVLAGGRAAGTLDVESDRTGAFSGSAILEYERLASALRSLWEDSAH